MAKIEHTEILQHLATLLDSNWIEQRACELGVVKRRRKIDLVALIWTLVLGFKEDEQRSLNGLRKRFMNSTRQTIAASSWRERFTPQLARLMKECLQKAISVQYS